jgi:hypothetical protein
MPRRERDQDHTFESALQKVGRLLNSPINEIGRSFHPLHFYCCRWFGPGGVRSLVAESLLLKHQLLILNRSRKRSPNLHASDRILAGLAAVLVRPTRLLRSAIVLKPSTLLGGRPKIDFFED